MEVSRLASQLLPGSLLVGDQTGNGDQPVTGNTTNKEKKRME